MLATSDILGRCKGQNEQHPRELGGGRERQGQDRETGGKHSLEKHWTEGEWGHTHTHTRGGESEGKRGGRKRREGKRERPIFHWGQPSTLKCTFNKCGGFTQSSLGARENFPFRCVKNYKKPTHRLATAFALLTHPCAFRWMGTERELCPYLQVYTSFHVS